MSRALYTLAWSLLLPLALGRLLWRSVHSPGYRSGVGERLARCADASRFQGAWWVHAVSVGETRAAQPLIEALLAHDRGARILLTQMTPTGRQTARELFARHGERVRCVYLPYDLPWFARRFLRAYRPRAGILMETEIWPNLIFEAQALEVPMVLANARLSARSASRYARLGGFARRVFGALSAVAAQSQDDAQRLAELGAKAPEVAGNVKFDVSPAPEMEARAAQLAELIGERRVLLAASTREGEEGEILTAFARHGSAQDLLLVVPRHPQRFDEVAALAQRQGLRLQRRSQAAPVERATRVLLGDSMGEMFAYFRVAAAALIGGSWQPLGGQNLIEACSVGTPVVVGPHTFNFSEATALAIDAGAALRAADVDLGMRQLIAIAHDAPTRERMSSAGKAFSLRHRGATERTVELLERVAPPRTR